MRDNFKNCRADGESECHFPDCSCLPEEEMLSQTTGLDVAKNIAAYGILALFCVVILVGVFG